MTRASLAAAEPGNCDMVGRSDARVTILAQAQQPSIALHGSQCSCEKRVAYGRAILDLSRGFPDMAAAARRLDAPSACARGAAAPAPHWKHTRFDRYRAVPRYYARACGHDCPGRHVRTRSPCDHAGPRRNGGGGRPGLYRARGRRSPVDRLAGKAGRGRRGGCRGRCWRRQRRPGRIRRCR